ncbi:MAG: palindromic element RPE1 domain-containing protein [Rickettsia endosymbiont of Pseudomimeciton antennatum]|nr:palindromic element RPE1 domain-containing protein [Rickettsia endosymbiont of Pseudomimeciton antennatum]MCC8398305.1 palindromic element RPE1 domain-containing protein [Rickettsia endosymbiont of Labidopullus appendiculatus]
MYFNRPLSKLAYVQGFEGNTSPRTVAYFNVREDSSTASLSKLPAKVEFRKRSNVTSVLVIPTISHKYFVKGTTPPSL